MKNDARGNMMKRCGMNTEKDKENDKEING